MRPLPRDHRVAADSNSALSSEGPVRGVHHKTRASNGRNILSRQDRINGRTRAERGQLVGSSASAVVAAVATPSANTSSAEWYDFMLFALNEIPPIGFGFIPIPLNQTAGINKCVNANRHAENLKSRIIGV